MADFSEQEKTEHATPKKEQEARDEGRIPRSPELGTAALLLAAAFTVNAIAPAVSGRVIDLFGGGLKSIGAMRDGEGAAVVLLQGTGRELLGIVAILAAGVTSTGLAVAALQARGVITMKPLGPNWERLNPITNAGQILGWQQVANLIKALVKVGIVGWAVWRSLSAAWPEFAELSSRDPVGLLATTQHYAVKLLVSSGLAYLVLAAADYVFQLWQHQKQMMMSKEEVRQESKQSDGDQQLKGRMRAAARGRIRRQMFKDVPKADVVIVNPTHVAVALQYDPLRAPAPFVLAMGQRKIAERIKQIAYEHDVPVIENKPLAWALLGAAQIGAMIPAELYAAVAEVLAFIIRQRALRGAPVRNYGTVPA
ncbi:MAG: EscU/YscU/HrcU family type III secretion system export apparatus switch protein [Gemmatimonadetes bacterium]|nr:EscU/YscU/HrcU family type III secretion system export apparatus switch protein [Gemmatimonadota bacterium]MBI3568665.1 EscU/YscU/HrcU family type III secretion system export apparatus switch protein [Gemmatimonadota bacterium]